MIRKATFRFVFIVLLFTSVAQGVEITFRGKTDKNPLEYQPGETMTFTVECFHDGKPAKNQNLRWIRSGDDGFVERADVKYSSNEPLQIRTSINTPGFVRIQVFPLDENGALIGNEHDEYRQFNGGAGVLLDQIRGADEPADFDEFWARQKAILDLTPIRATLTPIDSGDENVLAFDVKVDCSGLTPVSGYLVMPKDADKKSLPAEVHYQGYSVLPIWLDPNQGRDKIYFDVNCHGILNGQSGEYYQKLKETFLKNYGFSPEENQDPESCYWCGMMMRAMRAVQYVKTLPEWNQKDLVASGASQGGMQCLTVAGLDSDITEARAMIPWFCDVSGAELNHRLDSWFMPQWVDGLGYFDATNHAKRIKGKVSVVAGLGDYVCPPSGEMVLFNSIKTEKRIIFRQGRTHEIDARNADEYVLEAPASISEQ